MLKRYVHSALHLQTLHINLTINSSIASVNLGDSFVICQLQKYKKISIKNSTVCAFKITVLWNKH